MSRLEHKYLHTPHQQQDAALIQVLLDINISAALADLALYELTLGFVNVNVSNFCYTASAGLSRRQRHSQRPVHITLFFFK